MRIFFEPLYAREKRKVAHHLPGTVCEPLVFSSLGGHTPATIRRLPRGGARKGDVGVQPRVRQGAMQGISHALLSSVIPRFSAFQEVGSDSLREAEVVSPSLVGDAQHPLQQAVDAAAATADAAAVPHALAAGGEGDFPGVGAVGLDLDFLDT